MGMKIWRWKVMKPASHEFIYQKSPFPPVEPQAPPSSPAIEPFQVLNINGTCYIFNRFYKYIQVQVVNHRYSPLIPMSVDEQEVPPEYTPSMAATIPQTVHDQLSGQFLPAAKNLGQAGMHLLKQYYMFQEALSNYCDATHKLIKSADTAGYKSKQEARELSKVFKQFVQGVNAHQKIITEFDALAHKVHDYSAKDKEKLKAEFAEYKKEEKKIQKKKGGQSDKDVAAFHKKAAHDWSRQQELRYKFFNDKIHSWIKGYSDLAKLVQPEQPQVVVGETIVPPVVPEAVVEHQNHEHEHEHAHWHEELHETAAAVEAEEAKHKTVDQAVSAVSEANNSRTSSTSSVASTLEELPSNRRYTNDASVTLVSSNKRNSIEILPVAPVTNHHHHHHHNPPPAVPVKPIEQQYVAPRPVPAPRHDETAYAPRHNVVSSRVVPEQPNNSAPGAPTRRAGSTIPGAVNVFGFANQSNPQPNVRYTPVQNGAPYQVVTTDHIRVGRVVDNPVTEEQMNAKKFHVDANYVPLAAPSHQAQKHSRAGSNDINVPSFFNPSQYGSILIVNDDFNASSGEQMTVNRGDKVILLKCGSRGWVFVRDSISNRTGWVPEPYVNP